MIRLLAIAAMLFTGTAVAQTMDCSTGVCVIGSNAAPACVDGQCSQVRQEFVPTQVVQSFPIVQAAPVRRVFAPVRRVVQRQPVRRIFRWRPLANFRARLFRGCR